MSHCIGQDLEEAEPEAGPSGLGEQQQAGEDIFARSVNRLTSDKNSKTKELLETNEADQGKVRNLERQLKLEFRNRELLTTQEKF